MGFGAGGGLRPGPRPEPRLQPRIESSDSPGTVEDASNARPETVAAGPPIGFKSPLGAARLVRIFAVGTAAFAAVLVAYLRSAAAIVDQIRRDPLSVYQDDLLAVAQGTVRVAVGLVLVQGTMTILTGVWLRRLYRNLTVLGATSTRFGPGWAVGAWFVPFLNLVRPKQIVDETWRKSDPGLPDSFTAAHTAAQVSRLLHLWWGAWIVATLIGVAARLRGDEVGVDAVGVLLDIELAGGVAVAATALLLERVTARLTMRQYERAVRRGAAAPLARPWVLSLRRGPHLSARHFGVMAAPTLVAGAALVVGAWTIDTSLTDTPAAASSGSGASAEMRDLAVGDCFDIPPGQYVFLVSRVPCDQAHDAEFLHRIDLGEAAAPYPGEEAITDAIVADCLDAYAEFIGVAYEDSTLDFGFLYPIEASWGSGNTEAQCFIVTVDGSKLVGSTRSSGR